MKKLIYYSINYVFLSIFLLQSCDTKQKTEYETPPNYSEMQANLSESVNLRKASIIAQDFVKSKLNYPLESDFDDLGYSGEDLGNNRFKVLQKFTTKNAFGVTSEYIYKIFIQYHGGEWEDVNNWDYGQLIIENTATEEQKIFNGNLKSKETKKNYITSYAGIVVTVVEQNENFIRFSTPKKLTKKEIKSIINKISSIWNNIQICVEPKTERGDEYVSYIEPTIFDYDNNLVIAFDKW